MATMGGRASPNELGVALLYRVKGLLAVRKI
jgi:hypothetical protein